MDKPIFDPASAADRVQFAPEAGPRFILTVDTEEEFDWDKPFERTGHSVDSVLWLRKFQQFCEGFGVVPVYLVDYPIATSSLAAEVLHEAVAAGRAEVGVQLHPWVNPPHDEEINSFNSFAGNLPYELERAKFMVLRDTIAQNFGIKPLIYRAGRYGLGTETGRILKEAGIAVDTSVRARFDYSAEGGPNFRDLPLHPWWVGAPGELMELPLTTVYSGLLKRFGGWLYPRMWRVPMFRGVLARIGLLDRIPLTPEGVTTQEAIRGIDVALELGLPILVFSFHSPSLFPGYTPYVRNVDDLDALYAWWRDIFSHLSACNVTPTTVSQIIQSARVAS